MKKLTNFSLLLIFLLLDLHLEPDQDFFFKSLPLYIS